MVHSAPSRVSHDRHQQQEQEQDEQHPPFVLLQHHRQSRGNDWMSTRSLEAVFSSSPPPARRHERLLHFRSAFSEFERRDHGSPSTHLNTLSLRDDDYYFEDLEQARGSNAADVSVVPAAEAAATQVRSTAATIRRQYQQRHSTQPPGHRERQPDGLVGSSSTQNLGDASHSPTSKTALGFIMNRGEQPRSQLENAGDADPPNMLSHWDSQSRRASPQIAARVGVHQAPYDARVEDKDEEKKPAIYGPAGATRYSSDQAHGPPVTCCCASPSNKPDSHRKSPSIKGVCGYGNPSATFDTDKNQTNCSHGWQSETKNEAGATRKQSGSASCQEVQGRRVSKLHHQQGTLLPSRGGSLKCLVETCTRKGKTRGLCWSHGGGTKCSNASCPKVTVSNGFCWAHGGGKRCAFDGCTKAASARTHNYCVAHHELLKDGNVTLEV